MCDQAAAHLVGLHVTHRAALDLPDGAGTIGTGELAHARGLSPAAATALAELATALRVIDGATAVLNRDDRAAS